MSFPSSLIVHTIFASLMKTNDDIFILTIIFKIQNDLNFFESLKSGKVKGNCSHCIYSHQVHQWPDIWHLPVDPSLHKYFRVLCKRMVSYPSYRNDQNRRDCWGEGCQTRLIQSHIHHLNSRHFLAHHLRRRSHRHQLRFDHVYPVTWNLILLMTTTSGSAYHYVKHVCYLHLSIGSMAKKNTLARRSYKAPLASLGNGVFVSALTSYFVAFPPYFSDSFVILTTMFSVCIRKFGNYLFLFPSISAYYLCLYHTTLENGIERKKKKI